MSNFVLTFDFSKKHFFEKNTYLQYYRIRLWLIVYDKAEGKTQSCEE